jgi:hypothetical protein
MKHRFVLIETVINFHKKQLQEAGEILIRSIKTGKVYPVKKFNHLNHMRPTPAQIDKYYREKAGVFPTDAAKAKYNKTKPKAKKKVVPKKKKAVPKKKKVVAKKKKSIADLAKGMTGAQKMALLKKMKKSPTDNQINKLIDDIVFSADVDEGAKEIVKFAKWQKLSQSEFADVEERLLDELHGTGSAAWRIADTKASFAAAFDDLGFKPHGKKKVPKKKKVAKKKMVTKTIGMDPDEMFKLSDNDAEMLIDDIHSNLEGGKFGSVEVEKFNDQTVVANFTLPGDAHQKLYLGIENTKSAGGAYAKMVGNNSEPKLMAFFMNDYGEPVKRTYYDMDDLEVDLSEEWAGDIDNDEGHSDDDDPNPFTDPSGGKQKTKKFDVKVYSKEAQKRTADWRKGRVDKNHGSKHLRKMREGVHAAYRFKFDSESKDYYGGIRNMEEKFSKNFDEDVSQNPQWGSFIGNQDERIKKYRDAKNKPTEYDEIVEHVDNISTMINEQLTNPFVFRGFVGDDYEQDSWQLSKLSNLAFGNDPKDDYRYKKQVQEWGKSKDIKSDEDWKKDTATFKKIMKEQQEVLKKMGFVNDDGTVTLVRAISVASKHVPEYTDENKGVINADYVGSAADSWTLDYYTADGWDSSEGERVVVKTRVPLEKVIASSFGIPPQHLMSTQEHEVIINSRDLPNVELYPDYHSFMSPKRGSKLPPKSELDKRTEKIMENEQLDERRRKKKNKKDKKVKVNINNKRNIDWLRVNKKKTNKRK